MSGSVMRKLLKRCTPESTAGKWSLAAILVVVSIVILSEAEKAVFTKENKAEPVDIRDYALVPITLMQDQKFERWAGVLACEALRNGSPYESSVEFLVSQEGVLAYEGGDAEAFYESTEGGTVVRSEIPFHFEWWRGVVFEGSVRVEGWYAQGNPDVKPITFAGKLSDGKMSLQGTRGPRNCTLEAELKTGS